MAQHYETRFFVALNLPSRYLLEEMIGSLRALPWPDPGYGQIAQTWVRKIDYRQAKILLQKKDRSGAPLQDPRLASNLITIQLEAQLPRGYTIHIRSEDASLLPLSHNHDNVLRVKQALRSTAQGLSSKAQGATAKTPPPRPLFPPKTVILDDPYQILGIAPSATLAEISQAYLQQVKKNHPDRVGEMAPEFIHLAEERTKKINQAYEILKQLKQKAP
jgi:DnaJ-domain-containing protein 1